MNNRMYDVTDVSSNAEAEHIGNALVELLRLKPNSDGLYDTSYGTKTPTGLAKTVLAAMAKAQTSFKSAAENAII